MKRRVLVVLALLALTACTTTTSTDTIPTPDNTDIPADLLHTPGAAQRALEDIERRVGLSPAQVTDITIYAEYMIVEAQDPNVLDHIDTYTWRDDEVSAPEPVHLSGPQEDVDASLYPTTAVDLARLPDIVRTAERELETARPIRIEEAVATYLYIERSTSLDGRVVIRLSISGPRRSGNVETTSSGEILNATVS
ncbi:MAG: hypothetical protein EXQ79_10270 [Acidimicrobiia bacterium]|nr:hypothetical protein [Acidimicrobiia bacterium]